MMTFKPHPQTEERRQTITVLIKVVLLANQRPEILEKKYIRALLNTLLWKFTEVDGKFKTRYQSDGALRDRRKLRHDHVYPRAKMIDDLLDRPKEFKGILRRAIGCTVTLVEHKRLCKFDDEHAGWERYRKAEVSVRDTKTGKSKISVDSD
jgi:hypothetical protein